MHQWGVDGQGRVTNFNMKTLRNDLVFRLQSGGNLYTLEECRVLITEMVRTATAWQETEMTQLLYLSELHQKVLPGRKLVYQFPPCSVPSVPFSSTQGLHLQDNPLFRMTKVVEELNRSMIRMIDDLWCRRRERLLFAARLLKDLEEAVVPAPA